MSANFLKDTKKGCKGNRKKNHCFYPTLQVKAASYQYGCATAECVKVHFFSYYVEGKNGVM